MIDGFNLNLDKGTGIATYARNLSYEIHNLGLRSEVLYGTRAAPGMHPLLKEIAFFDAHVGKTPRWLEIWRAIQSSLTSPMGVKASRVPITGAVIATTYRSRLPYYDQIWNAPNLYNKADDMFRTYSRFIKVNGVKTPDIMHWTYPLPVRMPGAANIYTLHDLVPLRLPFTTLDVKRRYFKLMQRIVRKADHIVTVSETSRNDIINLLGCPERKVSNTYQSVEIPAVYANKTPEVVKREVEGAFGLPYKNYFLFYGSIEPKKNIGRIIEAYLASKVEGPLVIVGAQAWRSEEELRLVNETTNRYLEQIGNVTLLRDRIRQFDYAPFPLLVSLIKGAKALVFPSLYEGFGLPVLEGMLLGTPVITSTEGATLEVAGDAAFMVNPYDARALADAFVEIDRNEGLRDRLSTAGVKQAALFSPEKYRERLADVYARYTPKNTFSPRPQPIEPNERGNDAGPSDTNAGDTVSGGADSGDASSSETAA
ncbi:glycosyltransferase family 4 protein [Rhizobium sp. CFBP 8762]|nr:glycosyltransferase family 4 protein [Rhizobium sp. CFBP 8762]